MAARYWVGGTANWDATAGTKWSTTSGGAGGSAVPTSSDDVFFDGTSGAVTCTVNGTRVAKSVTCTGFTGTLDGSSQLTISGNFILSAGMTYNHTGIILINAASTITSAGKTITTLTTVNNALYTFTDNITIVNWNTSTTTGVSITGAININVTGIWNCNSNSGGVTFTGGTTVTLTGTAWQGNSNVSPIALIGANITINAPSTFTLTNNFRIGAGSVITYSAGTVVTTGTVLSTNGSVTFNTNGITWNNITFGTAGTITLSSDLSLSGILTYSAGMTVNGSTIYTGSLLITSTTSIGTSNIVFNGTGTWSHTSSGAIRNNITINTSGTLTISGTVRFDTGTLTYTSGTIITTGSTLIVGASTIINTAGMNWNNITLSVTQTLTINSLLTINGNLTYNSGTVITCAGTAGWTTANFFILTSNNISHVLVAGKTYTVTTYFESIATTSSLKDSLISGTPGTKAIFTLDYGATQNVGFTNAVDIDSSLGQTIWTFNGVVTTTFNWNAFTSSSGNQKTYII